jgi:outer membrane lipoprotein-sorting protein
MYLLILFSICNFAAAEVDIKDVVKKADLKRGLGVIPHSFTVTITNSGSDKVEAYKVSFKDINTTLSEQTAPERARGRKMLMKDYDMWLYTPNIKKPLRISLEQKLSGEVSYGDIARTNYAEDYDAKLLSTETINNAEVYKIQLIAKNKKVTYGKIEYLVNKKDNAPVEATFFALSGKALKRAEFQDFKMIKGLTRSTKMLIHDFLAKDKTSTLIFSGHTPETFDDSLFNKDRLEF